MVVRKITPPALLTQWPLYNVAYNVHLLILGYDPVCFVTPLNTIQRMQLSTPVTIARTSCIRLAFDCSKQLKSNTIQSHAGVTFRIGPQQ